MKKEYGVFLAVIALVSIGLAGWTKTVLQAPADSGDMRITSIAVVRPAFRPGERTSIRVSTNDNASGSVSYAWKANAGSLRAPDTDQVVWTAPESEGRYQVSVEVTNAAGARAHGSAMVMVSRHPADELIMSVDPMARKQPATHVAGRPSQAAGGN